MIGEGCYACTAASEIRGYLRALAHRDICADPNCHCRSKKKLDPAAYASPYARPQARAADDIPISENPPLALETPAKKEP